MAVSNVEPIAYISSTSLCNNDCVFCGLKKYNIRYQIPLEEIRQQLQHLQEYGAQRIVFTGGEPTIHPDIVEIIRSAKEIGYDSVSIFTNGRRVKDIDLLRELVEAGLKSVMVSLHGRTAQTHDQTVQRPGAFEETMGGIRMMSEINLPMVINTPVTAINLGEIASMYDMLAPLGEKVRRWQLSNLFPTSVVMNRPELHPAYEEIQEVIFEIMARAQTGHLRCVTQEFPLCVVFPWLNESRELSDDRKQLICRKDIQGDYRQYRPWTNLYKSKLPTCEPCGMRKRCGGIPLCYLMSHRDLSIFRPLEFISDESWRRQMGLSN